MRLIQSRCRGREPDDVFEIEVAAFGLPLRNRLKVKPVGAAPVRAL
jgi:hypothetical protein